MTTTWRMRRKSQDEGDGGNIATTRRP